MQAQRKINKIYNSKLTRALRQNIALITIDLSAANPQ